MTEKINKEKSIISGAIYLVISSVIVKVIGLIYKIPLSYILSDEGMSYFNSAYTVYTFFYIICTAGIPKAISIITAEHIGNGCNTLAKRISKTAFIFFSVFGIIISLLFILLSGAISKAIGNGGAKFSMLAVAPSIAFISASGVIRGYLNGKFSFLPIAVSEIINAASRLIFGIAFAVVASHFSMGSIAISACTLLGSTLGSLLGFVYLVICNKKDNSEVNSKQNDFLLINKKVTIISILKTALPITLTSALSSISAILDLSIIMNLLKKGGYSELQANILYGNYSTLVIPMLNLVAALIAPITTVLLPTVSSSKDNKDSISKSVSTAISVSLALSVPATLAFIFLPNEILSLLFDDSSAQMASPLLVLIAPSITLLSILSVLNTTLEANDRSIVPLLSLTVGALIKLFLTYIINRNGDYGLIGAPLGTVVFYFVGVLISLFYTIINQKLKLDLTAGVVKITLSSIVSVSVLVLIKRIITVQSSLIYILEMVVFAAVYLVMIIKLGFLKKYGLFLRQNAQKINKKII